MGADCIYTYKGKKYSEAEFKDLLLKGELDSELPKSLWSKAPKKVDEETDNAFSTHALDRANAKKVFAEVRRLPEPTDADQAALKYLADGGTVSHDAINEVAGNVKRARLNTGARELKSNEVKAREYAENSGESLDDIVHYIWELHGQKFDSMGIKNALIRDISEHKTRLDAGKEYLKRYSDGYEERVQHEKFYQEHLKEVAEEEEALNEWLSGNEEVETEAMNDEDFINQLIDKYETENQGEDKQSPAGKEEGTDTGTGNEGSPTEAEIAAQKLEAERDAKISDIQKPEPKLEFLTSKDIVDSEDPLGNKATHEKIKYNFKELKKLIECLWS